MRGWRLAGTVALHLAFVLVMAGGCHRQDTALARPPESPASVQSPAEGDSVGQGPADPDAGALEADTGELDAAKRATEGSSKESVEGVETIPLAVRNPGPGWASLIAYSRRLEGDSPWPGVRDIDVIDTISGRKWTIAKSLELHDDFCWSPDGSMVAIAASDGIHVAARDGSGLQQVVRPPAGGVGLVGWHPDGRHLVYVGHPRDWDDPAGQMIVLQSLESGGAKQLASGLVVTVASDARRLLYAREMPTMIKDKMGNLVSNTDLIVGDVRSDEEQSRPIPEGIMPDYYPFRIQVAFDGSAAIVSLMAEFGLHGYSVVPLNGSSANWLATCLEQALAVDSRDISPDLPRGYLPADGLALAPERQRLYWVLCDEELFVEPLSPGAKCRIWSTAPGARPKRLLLRQAPYLFGQLAISSDGKTLAYEFITTKGEDIAAEGIRLIGTDGTNDRELVAAGTSPRWCPVKPPGD